MSEIVVTWTDILTFALVVAAALIVLCWIWVDRRMKRAIHLRMQSETELPAAQPYRPAVLAAEQEETAKRFIALLSESRKSDS